MTCTFVSAFPSEFHRQLLFSPFLSRSDFSRVTQRSVARPIHFLLAFRYENASEQRNTRRENVKRRLTRQPVAVFKLPRNSLSAVLRASRLTVDSRPILLVAPHSNNVIHRYRPMKRFFSKRFRLKRISPSRVPCHTCSIERGTIVSSARSNYENKSFAVCQRRGRTAQPAAISLASFGCPKKSIAFFDSVSPNASASLAPVSGSPLSSNRSILETSGGERNS